MDIHYHDLGQGDQVAILLHGGGPGASGWSNFSRNVDVFSKKFRTIVVDLPGFGKSTKRAATGSVFEFMSDTIAGLMDALGIRSASFVGNSLGGGTSLKLCVRFPDRVDRLVLMGAAGSTPIFSPLSEGAKHLFNYYRGEGPTMEKLKSVIDCLVADKSALSDDLLQQRFEASKNPEVMANPPLKMLGRLPADEIWRDPLNTLKHKALIIWGREDRTVPMDAAFILLKSLRDAQLLVFPNCGHWVQWEKADEFNDTVVSFLSRKS
jgi:4,5:9,10-diseco-3-hydroxy-5,9,17-trioxoandrosta-1(10),2-diene-4-oate hydrolase